MAMTTSKTGYRAGYAPLPAGRLRRAVPRSARRRRRRGDRPRAGRLRPSARVADRAVGDGGDDHRTRARRRRLHPGTGAFLQGLAERCREHGILFVADEVQSGFGRTGKMFAVDARRHRARRRRAWRRASRRASRSRRSAHAPSSWTGGRRAATAARTAATRSAARPRSRRSTCMTEPGFLDNVRRARRRNSRPGLASSPVRRSGIVQVRGLGLMIATEFADAAVGRRGAPALPRPRASAADERRHLRHGAAVDAAARRRRAEISLALDAFADALKNV